ncbi:MAG: glycerophosphodiester phosphodiesterase [Fidelibacterota bacterium]|nr:MAG: glycerophosphodiester phosphodiesterase [Candidatus Neomarinimicrobiota bacterium]
MPTGLPWLVLLILLGYGVVAVVRYMWFWQAREVPFYAGGKKLYLAHRGVSSEAPENTLPAFLAAFSSGLDGIELDVMKTADDEIVVIHDHDLERITDGSGYVWETTYEDLARLNAAHHWHGTHPPTPIPRLEDVLKILPPQMVINIEVKTRHWFTPGLEKRVVQLVRRYHLVKRTIISSFNPFSLLKVRWLEPEVAIGFIWRDTLVPWYLRRPYLVNLVHPDLLHPHDAVVTPQVVTKAHRRGMRVNVWTVNNQPMIQYLESIGVDGIFTDFPELVLRDGKSSS